ncbi:MAG: DNA-directed RNA polymerase subunit omega [Chitinivibrionia bacterium]|nr:DNA-directed RNA polymerase subunit omega [Chitinivibrionia bacterium]
MKDIVIIDKLTGIMPNKYEAVRIMAKEARRINSIMLRSEHADADAKPTNMAIQRMLDNKIKYEYVDEGQQRHYKDVKFEDEG